MNDLVPQENMSNDIVPPENMQEPTISTAPKENFMERVTGEAWDKARNFLGYDETEKAKAANSLVYSEMFGIKPSVAYQYHDEISQQVQDKTASEKIVTKNRGAKESFKSGAESSIFGMMANQEVPAPFESVSQLDKWIHGFTQMSADIPFFLTGYILGGGTPVTGTAGGFGLTDGMRQVLIDRYNKGEVKSFQEANDRLWSAAKATIKGEIVGAATGGAGKLPYGYKAVKELAAMTITGKLVEGQVPTAQDFIDNAALLTAMHFGIKGYEAAKSKMTDSHSNLQKEYVENGKHPADVLIQELQNKIGNEINDLEETEPEKILRPAIKRGDDIQEGSVGQKHDDIELNTPEENRGFVTPDSKFIKRNEASNWLKENNPEIYNELSSDARKELHSGDLNEARDKVTGIKNEAVDRQREAMGMQPIESPMRKLAPDNWEQNKEDVDTGKVDPRALAKSINDNPRNLSPEETNYLNYDRAKLQHEHAQTMDDIERARQDGDEQAESIARERLKRVEDDINNNDLAAKKAGTEWGLTGQARQKMVAEDYSLARVLQRARIASKSGEVPDVTRAKLELLTNQLAEANKQIDAYRDELAKRESEQTFKQIQRESAKKQRVEKRTYKKEELKTQYDSLIKDLNHSLSSLNANPVFNPEAVSLLGKLAINRIQSGIVTIEGIVDDIHSSLTNQGYDFTKRDIRDAISGYGKTIEMSKDDVHVALREAKRVGQLLSALEDAQAKLAPLRSGLQRDKVTQEVRDLQKKVQQEMRKNGVSTKSPEQEYKSALDAVKTRLKNNIEDLVKRFETGEKEPKKVGIKPDEEAENLKAVRDKVKKALDFAEGNTGKKDLPPEQRIAMAKASLEKSIAEYERRINEEDFKPKSKDSKTSSTKELDALKKERDLLKNIYEDMKKDATPKKSPEERALQSFKTRTLNRIAEMEQKLKTGDFSKQPKKETILDPEAEKLRANADKLKTKINEAIKQQEFANKTKLEKGLHYFQKWRRAMLLSSVTTLGKLTSAAMQRFGITPIEELIGGVLSKLPGVKDIAAKAPREGGGLNISAEAKALGQFVDKATLEDVVETLKTGKGSLDYIYGNKAHLPPEALDFFGHLHGALKVLPKRAEFFRSLEKRTQWALDNHLDIQDPRVQSTLCADAYIDSNRAIFMDDNAVTTGYRMLINYFNSKGTGGKVVATGMQVMLPIVKVPTNFAKETFNYAGGAAKGTIQVLQTILSKDGLKNLTAYQADNIMRSLKKGSIGLALLSIGYYAADNVGGFYQQGDKKRRGEDLQAGDLKIGGVSLPHWALHSPPIEVLQMGATLRRVNDNYTMKNKDGGLMAGSLAAGVGLARTVPFFEEPARIAEATRTADTAGLFVDDLIKSLIIPPDIQKLAKETDPLSDYNISRKPSDLGETLKTGIPGLREDVPTKRKKFYGG